MRAVILSGLCLAARPGAVQAPSWVDCLATGKPSARWELPPLFREVSGLALTDDGRLLLHNDEIGAVGALDPATGAMVGSYQLGPRLPHDDFEDIAVVGNRLFLTSSNGILYETKLPGPKTAGGLLAFTVTQTGLGSQCEIEGLSHDPVDGVLLFACKHPRTDQLAKVITIFRWSLDKKSLASPDRLTIPRKALGKGRSSPGFRASGLTRVPGTDHYLLISALDQEVIEIDRSGTVVATGPVGRRHRQPEGVAIDGKGTLYLGDEGAKRTPGTVTAYACR